MSAPLRLLLTGSREVTDRLTVVVALSDACAGMKQGRRQVRLIHGAAPGADSTGARVWKDWVATWPHLFVPAEPHPAAWALCGTDCPTRPHRKTRRGGGEYCPLAGNRRNKHMVDLGADFCVSLAQSWDSGTGNCARLARAAGIPVLDAGCPTGLEDRPANLRRAA
jgi:hypothetical protein